jgi:glutamate synthase domain-containing protein 3
VRNSGAAAVVEGVGAHGCEYMTGGTVVVLGKTGANFGAGMTNGLAYVLDEDSLFATRCNTELVSVDTLSSEDDAALVPLLVAHAERTGSAIARTILSGWPSARSAFRRVTPKAAPALAPPVPQDPAAGAEEKPTLARPA